MCYHWYPTKMCGWSNPPVQSSWDNVTSPISVAMKPQGDMTTASVTVVGG